MIRSIRRFRRARRAVAAVLLVVALSWVLAGSARADAPRAAAEVTLSDAPLVDQDGAPAKFRSEVIGDRIVVVDFVFTTCTTVCPVLTSIFAQLQQRLGDRLDRGVRIVSVSLDPVRDTPARLKAYASKYGAGPGWTWLTGNQEDVERVLRGLGAYTPDFSAHSPMVLVGDGRSGAFTRFNGFPVQERIVEKVDELLAARAATASVQRRKEVVP